MIVINVYFYFLFFLSLFSLAYLNKSVSSLNFLLFTTDHVTMKVWLAVGGCVIHLDWFFPWTVRFAEFHIYHLIFVEYADAYHFTRNNKGLVGCRRMGNASLPFNMEQ